MRLFLLLMAAGLASAECPLSNIRASRELKSGQKDIHGDTLLLLTFKYTNSTQKSIVGMKLRAAWVDPVDDLHPTPWPLTADSKARPGATKNEGWREPIVPRDRKGWLIVPVKVMFEDGSKWEISASDKTCFGQTWWGKGHRDLPELPPELLQ